MKITILIVIGVMTGAAFFVYQKLFGGEIQDLPENKFVVGEAGLSPTVNEKKQNIVSVVNAKTPKEGVAEVIKASGDLDFIKPGQKVLVKPNVNSDDPAPGTTNPQALAEVVRQVKKKGAYVIVGDRSNPRWKTIPAMEKTGMYKAASDAGADEIVGFENEDWVRVKPEKAKNWPKGFRIPKRLSEFDHIISVPVLHTHSITGHSLALKNLVGLIHPADRMVFHASGKVDEMIAEISLAIKPSLTIIEGSKAFIDGGPSHGTLAEPKVYLASKDILAADIFGVELLKKYGANKLGDPRETRQISYANELGLGEYKKEKLENELKTL